jgi:hypothetical protein
MANQAGCAGLLETALASVVSHGRVVIHFHPDRIAQQGVSVADGLLVSGRFRNQFETGISAGSRTAFAGGAREDWEDRLFAGAYAHTNPAERPKYGALELIRYPDGPWPRFGSCFLVLHPHVTHRSTFTFAGSEQALAPERTGTIDLMETILVALFDEVADGGLARVPWPPFEAPTLGIENITVCGLLEKIANELPRERTETSGNEPGRVLDSGVEAQVHGDIDLRNDVECLIGDPSFVGTATGERLRDLSRESGVPLHWHRGFVLDVDHVPDGFRGPAMPTLARRIATRGFIDAAAIGVAEVSLVQAPEEWRDWGTHKETLQQLKQLWHVLVHYGVPAKP